MTKLWRRLLFLFRRERFDRDLDDEIRVHLEMKAEAGGGSDAARSAAAVRELAIVARNQPRDVGLGTA